MSGGRGYEGGRTRMVSSGVMRYLVGDGFVCRVLHENFAHLFFSLHYIAF